MVSRNPELRLKARTQLKGNWGTPILACFLYFVVSIGISIVGLIPVVGFIVSLLLPGALMLGLIIYMLKFSRGENPQVGTIFEGFNNFASALGLMLWTALWVILWFFVFIIPGYVKAVSYSMAFYVLADNPNIGVRQALNVSKAITKGYKGQIFMLCLSFIGWALLSILTLGIGFFWLVPYMQVSLANFYNELKAETMANGTYVTNVNANANQTM